MKVEVTKNNNHYVNFSKEEEKSSYKVGTQATRIQESLTKNSQVNTTPPVAAPPNPMQRGNKKGVSAIRYN